jgi:uncharacterized protein YeaO (DUF488 family)
MSFQVKRVYEEPSSRDGARILVERLWPRGVSKEDARLDDWLKEIAPSGELRQWFSHDPAKWEEFCRRYWDELKEQKELVATLRRRGARRRITLVYGSRDEEHNAAVALKRLLEQRP